jgi:hypothetical protein
MDPKPQSRPTLSPALIPICHWNHLSSGNAKHLQAVLLPVIIHQHLQET